MKETASQANETSDGTPPRTPADLDYCLPDDLIAQRPLAQRDASRMLCVDRRVNGLIDARITDLPTRLNRGDLLVLNDTKVLPAKLAARRETGGRIDGLFERETRPGEWVVMLTGSRRLRCGERLMVSDGADDPVYLRLVESLGGGRWRVQVLGDGSTEAILDRVGQVPLPPYIHRGRDDQSLDDRTRYQTVYARAAGAIAAPTAGLHLTNSLLDRIRESGVETVALTLHVGLGTFQPIRVDDLAQHEMHTESYRIEPKVVDAVRRCREVGGRVVAVGTTTVRALESAATGDGDAPLSTGDAETNIFIHPPYNFSVVDGLVTNFHLPQSTLLALVMAMGGTNLIRRAYDHAVGRRYRFFSYGDAMLIL